jgi:hypothetical protein
MYFICSFFMFNCGNHNLLLFGTGPKFKKSRQLNWTSLGIYLPGFNNEIFALFLFLQIMHGFERVKAT